MRNIAFLGKVKLHLLQFLEQLESIVVRDLWLVSDSDSDDSYDEFGFQASGIWEPESQSQCQGHQ